MVTDRDLRRSASVVATTLAVGALLLASVGARTVLGAPTGVPGPPFPDPVAGRAVHDYAGIFAPTTIDSAEATIASIRAATQAEIVVYSQVTSYGLTTERAESDAAALIDQWGIGRKGFDDSLVILFDMDPSLCHGQVQLFAGSGFRATYMSDLQRQRVYEDVMLPRLRDCDMNGALLGAIGEVSAAMTPEGRSRLELARQFNAVLGLLVAPLSFVLIVGWALARWLRYGRDPVYLDDPSILMPAPPRNLTAAAAAAIQEGKTGPRAMTTALLDLASRGKIAFREEHRLLGIGKAKVGIDLGPEPADDRDAARRGLNARRPLGEAERFLETTLGNLAPASGTGESREEAQISSSDLKALAGSAGAFGELVEASLVKNGWMTDRPSRVRTRWYGLAALIAALGIGALVLGFNVPMSGLVVVAGALVAAAVVVGIVGYSMPAATMAGAIIRAMLAAYRRTLEKTMAQARSMDQVIEEAQLDWLTTPDQAVVWGTALGLQGAVEAVLSRSLEDAKEGRSGGVPYFPGWYLNADGQSAGSLAGSGLGGGGSLFSSGGVPDVGSMMGALGTIGAPASSGSSGGGGSGGGGGAGGGF